MDNLNHANNLSSSAASPIWAGGTTSTTPSFSYPGGKTRLRSTIVSYMPKSGGTYAEPFAGRAACFWKAAKTLQFSHWWLNDLRTSPFFNALISHGDTIEVPPHTRDEFDRKKIAYAAGDPSSIILAPYLTYNGAGYEASYRSPKGSPTQAGYERTLRNAHNILMQTQPKITDHDWKVVHDDLREGDLALYDPPYIGAKVHGYGADDLDHREMIEALRTAPYRWILCEYMHEAYVEAFGPPFWSKAVQLCSTNFRQDGGKAVRVECMWKNY